MPSAPPKPPRKLACMCCQSRKKKCDRKSPCSLCLEKGLVCTPSTPAPSRKRRQPTRELLERMARCEELLRLCLEQNAIPQPALPANPPSPLSSTTSSASGSSPQSSNSHESDERDRALPSTENDELVPDGMSLRPKS